MSVFTVYPAIDVRDGRVVRLHQGDYDQETRYPHNPLALARHYAEAGASWLHLVDLDAARLGGYTLRVLLAAIRAQTGLRIQTGGGVRRAEDVQMLLEAGAERVVVGSLAVRTPDEVAGWLLRFGPERLTLALDTRQDENGAWRLPVHGWTEDSGRDLFDLVERYVHDGLRHLLCTDIARDGALTGPNVPLYAELSSRFPCVAVQASGGARDLADISAAKAAGCGGIVLGKALLEDRFTVPSALAEAAAC